MLEVLVNRLGGLSLPRKSVVRLTDRPNMTLDVYGGCKTTIQYNNVPALYLFGIDHEIFSVAIFPLPLVQEGQLLVTGDSMGT